MPFKRQEQVTRVPHIRDLVIRLVRTIDEDDHDYPQGIDFSLTIDDQFDSPMGHRSGDLVPHLTAGQISALQDFMDAMWAKAVDEVIG
jgi:hypothetical protein